MKDHKIITLPVELSNQIAAGEVVERPLSVVKELLENALDAEAHHIEIEVENGGIDLIRVKDNGVGIPKEEIPKALLKYSTSKISSLEDLYRVMTFGFRGEALASISSVSEFSLCSKTQWETAGTIVQTSSGHQEISETAHNVGTSVVVKNLFYNTPARKAYLKTPRTEYQKIADFVQKTALCFPHISFQLRHDGKNTFSYPKASSLKERIRSIYDREYAESMLDIHYEFAWITLRGYISDPKIFYTNKQKQVLFVNNRYIHSPMISKAIIDAYNRFIPPGKYPGYVLFLDIDPTQIDANVHPRKMEIRFAAEQQIYRAFYHALKDRLEKVSLSSSFHTETTIQDTSLWEKISHKKNTPLKYHTGSGTRFKNYSPYTNTLPHPTQNAIEFTKNILQDSKSSEAIFPKNPKIGRVLWQLHHSYIVVETDTGLKILDQHALAERVIYEKLSHSSYTPNTQKLLFPTEVHLEGAEQEQLEQYSDMFVSMWFQIHWQWDILEVTEIPDFVSKNNIEQLIKNILWDMTSVGSKSLEEIRHKMWAYTACRSAIKFGDPLTHFEMEKLLEDASIHYSSTCPHGRPVVYEVSLDELAKKYERE